MNNKVVIALLAAALPCLAEAQSAGSYECTLDDQLRRVEILSEPGAVVPCEVHYYKDKDAPDEKQVLWNATNQAGYCESRTEEFIAKLEGWGWDCGQAEASMPEPQSDIDADIDAGIETDDDAAVEAGTGDDTDDLKPATN